MLSIRYAVLILVGVALGCGPVWAKITANDLYRIEGGLPASEDTDMYLGKHVAAGGQVAGSLVTPASLHHAAVWNNAGTLIDLHPTGFFKSQAMATDGQQQVGYGTPNGSLSEHALLWNGTNTPIDLNPPNYLGSYAFAVKGGQQVGIGGSAATGNVYRALLWNGTNNAIDLTPANIPTAWARGTDGHQQVGWGEGPAFSNHSHAMLWHGTNNAIDLHPAGFRDTFAEGVGDGQQVGWGNGPATADADHALLWNGTNAVTDLNPAGFSITYAYDADGGLQTGFGRGNSTGNMNHALVWQGSASRFIDLHKLLSTEEVFWSWSFAYAVEGTTVYGIARDEGGFLHAVSWTNVTNVPEPAVLTLLAVPALLRRRR